MSRTASKLSPPTFEVGTMVLGDRYRIDRLLGRGSYGEVYAVTEVALNARRAMKVVWRAGGREVAWSYFAGRFETELQLAALVHDGSESDVRVLRVFEAATDGDMLYGVMELAQGGSLADELSRREAQGSPVSIDEAVRWLTDAARGLASLNNKGYIHVDVKPGNILLMAHGGAVIGDLGSAQRGNFSYPPSERVGTPDYASPEHRTALHLSAAADVYGLGCVAFELLTGERWASWRGRWQDGGDGSTGDRASELRRDVTPCVGDGLRTLRPDAPEWMTPLIAGMLQTRIGEGEANGEGGAVRFDSMAPVLQVLAAGHASDRGATAKRRTGRTNEAPRAPSARDGAAQRPGAESGARSDGAAPRVTAGAVGAAELERALDMLDAGDGEGALALLVALRDGGYRSPADDLGTLIAEAERLVAEAERPHRAREAYAHVLMLSRRAVTWELGHAAWERYRTDFPEFGDAEGLAVQYASAEQRRLLEAMRDIRRPVEERAEAGRELAAIGDPRAGVGLRPDGVPDIAWIEVPGGAFQMGADDEPPWKGTWEAERTVQMPRYWVSRYPTTWTQYEAFLTAEHGYCNAVWWKGLAIRPGESGKSEWPLSNHPAENVNWYDAVAFTRWLSSRLGYLVRLPTEAEWEKAARGTDGRRFPWGDEYEEGRANIDERWPEDHPVGTHYLERTTAVGLYIQGNLYGLEDMAGNVWEWTATDRVIPTYSDGRARPTDYLMDNTLRVVRGGSWEHDHRFARADHSELDIPENRYSNVGFRVVSSAPCRSYI